MYLNSDFILPFFRIFFRLSPFVAQKYDVPIMRQKIKEIIERDRIDLVHVDMLPLTVFITEFTHVPKVLVNHNVESLRLHRWFRTESNIIKKIYLGLQWIKLRKFERSAIDKHNSCVVVSEIDKKILRQMGTTKPIFVVPNGTDTQFFQPLGKRIEPNSVLWVGHMDVHTNKNAVLFFWREIYPLLRRKYPQVRMTFVGTDPPGEIVACARNDRQVIATGFVDDIRPYLDETSVMVVPIKIGSGTRIKILDGMAMGKAIVSTSIGCEGLDVVPGRDILVADDPEDFACKTIELLKDSQKRIALEENALRFSQKLMIGPTLQ